MLMFLVDVWYKVGIDIWVNVEKMGIIEVYMFEQDGVEEVMMIVGQGLLCFMFIYKMEKSYLIYVQLVIRMQDGELLEV